MHKNELNKIKEFEKGRISYKKLKEELMLLFGEYMGLIILLNIVTESEDEAEKMLKLYQNTALNELSSDNQETIVLTLDNRNLGRLNAKS